MRSFLLLLKIQLLGLFGINKALHADASKAKRSIAVAVLAAIGIVAIAVWYSATVADAMAKFGLTELIPFTAVMVGSAVGAMAAFMKTNGLLFAFKDYDLVMSLPVPVSSVVLSRLASLYAMALAFSALAMAPALVVYAARAGVTGIGAVCAIAAVFLAPLLPLAVAIALAALISGASSRFRHANIVTVALSIIVVVAVVFGSFALSGWRGGEAALAAIGPWQIAALEGSYPLGAWAAAGIQEGNLLAFMGFAAVSLGSVFALLAVLVRVFIPVNALLMSSRLRGTFSFDGASGGACARGGQSSHVPRSAFCALVVKEARLLVATPVYLLNTCIGYVLVLVGAVAAMIARISGVAPLDVLPPELAPLIGLLLPWAVAFCTSISSTTAPSVSLEGSSRWLMQTAPVPARTVLGAKAALNLIFAMPTIFMGGALLAFSFSLDVLSTLALFVVPTACSLFATFFGLALDARHPRYDWTTVYEPVKRSLPVFALAIGGMVLVGLGVAVTAFGGVGAGLAASLALGAASIGLFCETVKHGLV